MSLAPVINAILEKDWPRMRTCFLSLVDACQRDGFGKAFSFQCAAGIELCRALEDDVALMPNALCARLNMPEGSTYARGGDKILSIASTARRLGRSPPVLARGSYR